MDTKGGKPQGVGGGGVMNWKYGSDEDVIQIKVLSGTELFDRPGEYVEFHVASE